MRVSNRIIAIIPARGGSKGVEKKNIRLLGDKPLIHYTIHAALKSKYINDIFVSTDDDEIMKVALAEGATAIKRPKKISEDDSPTIDAILHILDRYTLQESEPEIILLLQPTSPFRTVSDIDNALELFLTGNCDSVISVTEANHSPYWYMEMKGDFLEPLFDQESLKLRRQDLPRTYLPNGAIYIASSRTLKNTHSFYNPKTKPYIMSAENSLDIDSELDLLFAEALMKRGTGYH